MIVCSPFAPLGRRLPGVLGVPELTLRELVESGVLAAENVELVLPLILVHVYRVDR